MPLKNTFKILFKTGRMDTARSLAWAGESIDLEETSVSRLRPAEGSLCYEGSQLGSRSKVRREVRAEDGVAHLS